MIVTPLPFDLEVSTHAKVLTVNIAYFLCKVVVLEREFLVNLICLPPIISQDYSRNGLDVISLCYVILCSEVGYFPESGVVKYLSANQLKVSLKIGAFDLSILASTEVIS